MRFAKKEYEWGSEISAIRKLAEYGRARKEEIGADKVFDYSLGNPSVPPPAIVNQAIKEMIETLPDALVHGYTSGPGDLTVREAIADFIEQTYQVEADPQLIYVATGAASSLAMLAHALTSSPEDEFLTFTPFFPEYRVFVESAGAKLVESPCLAGSFQPDLDHFKEALSEKTKAVIINLPNNPTGVIYEDEAIKSILDIMRSKEEEYGHPIYLISDEPYREIVYEKEVPYFPALYDNTLTVYSFSKSLSLAGERVGYLSVNPKAAFAKELYAAVAGAARGMGYVCAPSLFQRILPQCLGKTADLSVYRKNRDLLYQALTAYGFEAVYPDGAFYLFVKSPIKDAEEFSELAKKHELLLVPSDSFGYPGYLRLSYCVSTEMIEESLPAFQALAKEFGLDKQ